MCSYSDVGITCITYRQYLTPCIIGVIHSHHVVFIAQLYYVALQVKYVIIRCWRCVVSAVITVYTKRITAFVIGEYQTVYVLSKYILS